MRKRIAIIDGYNVIYRDASLKKQLDISLANARKGLVDFCIRWLSRRGDISEFWVVFDGDSSVMPLSGTSSRGVRVVFTRTKEDADDRILSLLRDVDDDTDYVVISSDNYVSGNSKRMGARVMSASDFFSTGTAGGKSFSKRLNHCEHADLSPIQERMINESLKEWGIE